MVTKYFSVPGLPTAMKVGSTLSFLLLDGLGSIETALYGILGVLRTGAQWHLLSVSYPPDQTCH